MGKLFAALSLVVFLNITTSAQKTDFKRDSVEFLDYAVSLVKDLPRKMKDKREYFEERFTKNWYSGRYSATQRDTIYSLTEKLIKNRFRVYPDLYRYLIMTDYLIGNKKLFRDWHESVKQLLLDNKKKETSRFIKKSHALFYGNQLHNENSVNWQVQADTFAFRPGLEPAFIYKNCTLKGYSDTDSSLLLNTSGAYYPVSFQWEGQGGKVYWKRAGYDTSRIYTVLTDYEIDVRESHFTDDSALFYDKELFEKPISGRFVEGYLYKFQGKNIRYPQFYSSRFFVLEDILKNITLKGYLRYEGDKLIVGTSKDNQEEAEALMEKKGKEYLRVYSPRLLVQKERFFAYNASASIYIGENDSIFHPSVGFEYNQQNGRLKMLPKQNKGSIMPYSNSYHKLDMYCRELVWSMQDSILQFREIGGMDRKGGAIFESYDYYSEKSYYNIQLMDRTNPLELLNELAQEKDRMQLTNKELMRYTGRAPYQVDLLLLRLARKGFIIYDRQQKEFQLKPKVPNYLMAKFGLRDYDVMRFISRVEDESNAELNLTNYDLDIKGIPEIQLSDSQRVMIYPKNNHIKMKKNRDFQFSGRIVAGNTELFGSSCSFDYKQFAVSLPSIDSLRFYIPGSYINGADPYSLIPVRTVVEDLSGKLRIDKPNNKSGLKPSPGYPILKSGERSFAYYDKYSRYKDVYDRERFKYQLEPFTIDSLDDFYPTALEFEGHLESDIFPDIKEPLTIQSDLSLGFDYSTPQDGLHTYQGKGKYYQNLSLSNQGLIGKGKLNYISSTSRAHRVIFFPDSARGTINSFHLEHRPGENDFPLVNVDTALMRWLHPSDSMIISNPRVPFSMYEQQVKLDGSLALTPKALKGRGDMSYNKASINSDEFNFLYDELFTHSGDIAISADSGDEDALRFTDYYAQIQIGKQRGVFNKNPGGSLIEFPFNQYISFLDHAEWDVPGDKLAMNAADIQNLASLDTLTVREIVDKELSGARFISTNPEQDSLSFIALKADYDLTENIIEAKEVKYINVADAAIFPHRERLSIGKEASIHQLENARILADLQNKAHLIENASVEISSKHYYTGDGAYQYLKEEQNKEKTIYFDSLWVDENVSKGLANISDENDFELGSGFDYFGSVHMSGNDSLLQFDGYYQLLNDICLKQKDVWVKFNAPVDQDHVMLPVSYPLLDRDGNELYAGYMFFPREREINALYLEKDTMALHYPFWKAEGHIAWQSEKLQYRIAGAEKIKNSDTTGMYMEMNTGDCSYESNSELDFTGLFGRMKVVPSGRMEYKSSDKSLSMKTILGIDFYFDRRLRKMMIDSLKRYDLERVELEKDWFRKTVKTYLGREKAEEIIVDQNLYGEPREMPEEMKQTLFFTDINFNWNQELNSFIAAGEIGLGNIDDEVISRYVNGVVEIQPTQEGGNINIYLNPTDDTWYFFTYSNNYLDVLSSDPNFNSRLSEMKGKKRRLNRKNGKPPFEYTLGGENLKDFFLRRIEKAGIRYK